MNTNDTPQDLTPGDVTPTQPASSVSAGETAPTAPAPATPTAPASDTPVDTADAQPAQKQRPRGRAGLIAGSIVGGVLVIALAFGGGTALGWALGTHDGQSTMSQDGPGFGPNDGDVLPGGPGQQQERQPQDQQDQRQQDPRDQQDQQDQQDQRQQDQPQHQDPRERGLEEGDTAEPTPAPTT